MGIISHDIITRFEIIDKKGIDNEQLLVKLQQTTKYIYEIETLNKELN